MRRRERTGRTSLIQVLRISLTIIVIGSVLLGSPGSAGASQPPQSDWNIDTAPTLSTLRGQVSCPTSTFCMSAWVTNSPQNSATVQAYTWNPQSNQQWVDAQFPSTISVGLLTGVDCISPTSCLIYGAQAGAQLPGGEAALVARWNGSSWSFDSQIAPLVQFESEIDALSCASANFCLATARYFLGQWTEAAEMWNGTSWQFVSSPVGSINDFNQAISCPSSTFCALSGTHEDTSYLETWNGTNWTSSNGLANPSLVSCASPTFCMAVGGFDSAIWNGTQWASQAPGPWIWNPYTLSCASSIACLMTGQSSSPDLQPKYASWNGQAWELQANPFPLPTGASTGLVEDLSCPSTVQCVAAGRSNASTGVDLPTVPMVDTYNFGPRPSLGRYVALGDSVPYGHGLADPSTTPYDGLPAQGSPSTQAYPSLVAQAIGYKLAVRSTYCSLSGDQLTVSGAHMSVDNRVGRWKDCPRNGTVPNVYPDEFNAANFAQDPPTLVTIQAGADDINFAGCLKGALALPAKLGAKRCVNRTGITSKISSELANVTNSLSQLITAIASATNGKTRVLVLDYYDPIPNPSSFVQDGSFLCTALATRNAAAYQEALLVQGALNLAISQGVTQAASGPTHPQATFVDIADVLGGISSNIAHNVCTAQPWLFSGDPFDGLFWRAVHPNALGQAAIAQVVESRLHAG